MNRNRSSSPAPSSTWSVSSVTVRTTPAAANESLHAPSEPSPTWSSDVDVNGFDTEDGNLLLQTGDTVHRVHWFIFRRHSEWFRDLYGAHQANDSSSVIILEGVGTKDMLCLLNLLYPTDLNSCSLSSKEEWSSVLHLAHEFRFDSARELAERMLFPLASPLEKIIIGRRYQIPGWLLDAYVAVCESDDDISLEDGERLGMADVIAITRARREITRRFMPTEEIRYTVWRTCCPAIDVPDLVSMHAAKTLEEQVAATNPLKQARLLTLQRRAEVNAVRIRARAAEAALREAEQREYKLLGERGTPPESSDEPYSSARQRFIVETSSPVNRTRPVPSRENLNRAAREHSLSQLQTNFGLRSVVDDMSPTSSTEAHSFGTDPVLRVREHLPPLTPELRVIEPEANVSFGASDSSVDLTAARAHVENGWEPMSEDRRESVEDERHSENSKSHGHSLRMSISETLIGLEEVAEKIITRGSKEIRVYPPSVPEDDASQHQIESPLTESLSTGDESEIPGERDVATPTLVVFRAPGDLTHEDGVWEVVTDAEPATSVPRAPFLESSPMGADTPLTEKEVNIEPQAHNADNRSLSESERDGEDVHDDSATVVDSTEDHTYDESGPNSPTCSPDEPARPVTPTQYEPAPSAPITPSRPRGRTSGTSFVEFKPHWSLAEAAEHFHVHAPEQHQDEQPREPEHTSYSAADQRRHWEEPGRMAKRIELQARIASTTADLQHAEQAAVEAIEDAYALSRAADEADAVLRRFRLNISADEDTAAKAEALKQQAAESKKQVAAALDKAHSAEMACKAARETIVKLEYELAELDMDAPHEGLARISEDDEITPTQQRWSVAFPSSPGADDDDEAPPLVTVSPAISSMSMMSESENEADPTRTIKLSKRAAKRRRKARRQSKGSQSEIALA